MKRNIETKEINIYRPFVWFDDWMCFDDILNKKIYFTYMSNVKFIKHGDIKIIDFTKVRDKHIEL